MKLSCRSLDSLPPMYLSPLTLSAKVLQLVFFFGLLSTVTGVTMNQLQAFGINHGLPKSEFIHHLATNSTEHLKSLREYLFVDACKANLIPLELHGLPLVGRRDTVTRPASTALSEDIWTIVTCITNKTVLPRTMMKNGKRSKQFLIDAPRTAPAPTSISSPPGQPPGQSSSGTPTSNNEPPVRLYPVQESQLDQSPVHQLPSSSVFSNSFISREINHLKDELRSLKADIASINRRPPAVFPSELQRQFGQELKVIRDEISHLQDCMNEVSNPVQTPHYQRI